MNAFERKPLSKLIVVMLVEIRKFKTKIKYCERLTIVDFSIESILFGKKTRVPNQSKSSYWSPVVAC